MEPRRETRARVRAVANRTASGLVVFDGARWVERFFRVLMTMPAHPPPAEPEKKSLGNNDCGSAAQARARARVRVVDRHGALQDPAQRVFPRVLPLRRGPRRGHDVAKLWDHRQRRAVRPGAAGRTRGAARGGGAVRRRGRAVRLLLERGERVGAGERERRRQRQGLGRRRAPDGQPAPIAGGAHARGVRGALEPGAQGLLPERLVGRHREAVVPRRSPASLRTFAEHSYCVYAAVWSPQHADIFATASGDCTLKVFDARTQFSTLTIPAHEYEILCCDWNKYNDCVVATGSVDKTVRLWDIRSPRRELAQIAGHSYAVRRVRCDPWNESIVYTCSYDMTVRCGTTRRLVGRLAGSRRRCGGGGITPSSPSVSTRERVDRGVVGSCGWDEQVAVWHRDVDP